MRLFFLLGYVFILSSCFSENKKENTKTLIGLPSCFKPPKTVLAASPLIAQIDSCLAPNSIVIPTVPITNTSESGEMIKVYPPVEIPIDFYGNIQHYTTEQGLAINN